MRSLINTVPSLWLVIAVVGGTVALALLGVIGARKAFPNLAEGPFEEMADGLRVVFELVFALILAFVISSVLDSFSTAEATVEAEATSLAHMKRSNMNLAVDQQLRLDEGLNQYVHAVVEQEWEAMRDAEDSPRAAAALETLYALYQSYDPPPAAGPEAEFYRQAVDELGTASATRRDRIGLSKAELPALLRLFLPLGVVMLLVLEYRPKMRPRAQLVHVGTLAAVASFTYLLTILLDYPFAGDISVSSDPFKQGVLAEYWSSGEPRVLGAGEAEQDLTPGQLVGVWNSDTVGVIVFREVGDEVHGVYRSGEGSVAGQVSDDGVFRGWWCRTPTRRPPGDAGDVEWRLVRSSAGEVVFGSWRYGSAEAFRGGWDLRSVGGPEPPDLAPRFDDPSSFCRRP